RLEGGGNLLRSAAEKELRAEQEHEEAGHASADRADHLPWDFRGRRARGGGAGRVRRNRARYVRRRRAWRLRRQDEWKLRAASLDDERLFLAALWLVRQWNRVVLRLLVHLADRVGDVDGAELLRRS